MKLILVNPVNRNRVGMSQAHRLRYPPLNLTILAALTPSDWEVVIQDENVAAHEMVYDADLVGITSFTSTAPRAYGIADAYTAIGVPVVLGGIHAWARAGEAQSHGNLVIGEAEGAWGMVCDSAAQHLLRDRRMQFRAPVMPRAFALPRRDLLAKLGNGSGYFVESASTSRGCPESCSFCSVHQFSGRRFRRQRLDLIEQDMAAIKADDVIFVDDNFCGGPIEETLEVLRVVGQFGRKFTAQVTMAATQDEEILAALRQAGCRMLFIGVESGDDAGLVETGKRQNLRIRDRARMFDRVHAAGVAVLGAFIYGFDSDTAEKIRERGRFALECGADAIQSTLLTPLPGTRLWSDVYDRLLYRDFPADWARYDFTEAVFCPAGFRDVREFYEAMCPVMEDVYSDASVKAMARRTFAATQCREASITAQWTSMQFADLWAARLASWRQEHLAKASFSVAPATKTAC